ncbi:MAG: fluoride efflux transporter CrcB [Lachnospiraceae bacterium]|nr:fluoride efflux transporter CrcB [Lachnospiraceae bacterium]
MNILAVGAGGFFGAVLRYLIGRIPVSESTVFPIKTFAINVIGCLAIGLITVLAAKNTHIDQRWILFMKVGLCGGFTTFSTFALETTDLIKGGHTGVAFLYVIFSMIVGCAVIFGAELMMSK